MSYRISIKDLESLCSHLNELTGSPMEYSSNKKGEPFKSNIGHYTISLAYGGAELQRVMNEGGGVSCPLSSGHVPKRELYEQMQSFIRGLESAKELLK